MLCLVPRVAVGLMTFCDVCMLHFHRSRSAQVDSVEKVTKVVSAGDLPRHTQYFGRVWGGQVPLGFPGYSLLKSPGSSGMSGVTAAKVPGTRVVMGKPPFKIIGYLRHNGLHTLNILGYVGYVRLVSFAILGYVVPGG